MPLICQAFICGGAHGAPAQTNVLSFSGWHYILLTQPSKYVHPLLCIRVHLLLLYFITPACFYCLYLVFFVRPCCVPALFMGTKRAVSSRPPGGKVCKPPVAICLSLPLPFSRFITPSFYSLVSFVILFAVFPAF